MIAIIDYGAGNAQSVKNALAALGVDSSIVKSPERIGNAQRIIFPGVGSFGFAMEELGKRKLIWPIKRAIASGKPFLGICLGLQLLFEESEESPGIKGLGVFKGKVVKFRKGKVPQVGWNKLIPTKDFRPGLSLFESGYCYFVNSYHAVPEEKRIIAATSDYFGEFASGMRWKNITACQFHPEKSGAFGLELLGRWLRC